MFVAVVSRYTRTRSTSRVRAAPTSSTSSPTHSSADAASRLDQVTVFVHMIVRVRLSVALSHLFSFNAVFSQISQPVPSWVNGAASRGPIVLPKAV